MAYVNISCFARVVPFDEVPKHLSYTLFVLRESGEPSYVYEKVTLAVLEHRWYLRQAGVVAAGAHRVLLLSGFAGASFSLWEGATTDGIAAWYVQCCFHVNS